MGLFAALDKDATIKNLEIMVHGRGIEGTNNVGALAGISKGNITGVTVVGSEIRGSIKAGGLVGHQAGGNIDNSKITAGASTPIIRGLQQIGGLVGYQESGSITGSSAIGSVGESTAYQVGGLVGESAGSIENSSFTSLDSTVEGKNQVGGLVGYQTDGSIAGSSADGSVGLDASKRVGGLVGHQINGSIANSSFNGLIVLGSEKIGGLVGYQPGGSITESSVSTTVKGRKQVGGLVGVSKSIILNSHVRRIVVQKPPSLTGNEPEEPVGGLVGKQDGGSITGSSASGRVEGRSYVGGLVGKQEANSIIIRSWANGSVKGKSYVGGLVGQMNGSIENSYAIGSVQPLDGDTLMWAGGLVGFATAGSITNSYATGMLMGSAQTLGGLLGSSSRTTITGSYYDENSTKQSKGQGLGPATVSITPYYTQGDNTVRTLKVGGAVILQSDFPWNFTIIWTMAAAGEWPTLLNNPPPIQS